MDRQQPQWGRFEPSIGAVVDDKSQSVWAKGLGWVNAKGDVFTGGKLFPSDAHHPDTQGPARAVAAKAAQFFSAGGAPQASAPAQMKAFTASTLAPPVETQAPHPEPHHALLADSWKALARHLTGGK